MPVQWDMPRTAAAWQKSADDFAKMPIKMALQQVKRAPDWNRWGAKYGTIAWEANMGDILQGVIAEPSPITQQKATPRNITEVPKKHVITHRERSNTARVKRQLVESPLMHFLPSWRDFRKGELKFAMDDIARQISYLDSRFIRWQALQQCRWVYICGADEPLIRGPYGEATDTSEPKDANFFAEIATKIGATNGGFLSFTEIINAASMVMNELGVYPWEDMPSMPKNNEPVKGKLLMTGDSEIWEGLSVDPTVLSTKDSRVDYLTGPFQGVIGGRVVFQADKYPLRYKAADGSFPAPEIEELNPDNEKEAEVVPNSEYTRDANIGITFLEGDQPFETIKVGPPPKEFSTGSIDPARFTELRWDGEVRITDNVLVNYGGDLPDTNKYGEYLQLIADVTHGILPKTPRNLVAVVYRRNSRPARSIRLP